MDHQDDVQRLFSWLQTPDLRYREFARDREVPDRVSTAPTTRNAAAAAPQAGQSNTGLRQPDFAEPVTPPPERPSAGLLGGAYRGDEPTGSSPADPAPQAAPASGGEQAAPRSLDSVFGRLAGTRQRLPDPRERPRQGPGAGPSGGRSR